jgi:micrococcal nuclease
MEVAVRRIALLALSVLFAAGCSSAPPASHGEATVRRVVDGDTIEVRIAGRVERVRLLGVDTPESVGDRPHECFGKEASAYTAALLPPGTGVRLVRDAEPRDDYGRLLAYVYIGDRMVNLLLATGGYADVLSIRPNIAHAEELRAAVLSARRSGLGLWGTCGGPDVTLVASGNGNGSGNGAGSG